MAYKIRFQGAYTRISCIKLSKYIWWNPILGERKKKEANLGVILYVHKFCTGVRGSTVKHPNYIQIRYSQIFKCHYHRFRLFIGWTRIEKLKKKSNTSANEKIGTSTKQGRIQRKSLGELFKTFWKTKKKKNSHELQRL